MALLLTSTETRQTVIIGSKNIFYSPNAAEEASEPAETKSIQNQLFKLREGEYGRHTLARLLYTQLSISPWQGFPACLCGECGFMFVKLRLRREARSRKLFSRGVLE